MTKQPHNQSRRCTATCADGRPCRAWAVRGSDPPRCSSHGGGRAPVGAPPGNQNACTHGFYAQGPADDDGGDDWCDAWRPSEDVCRIDAVIADLYAKQQRLSRYIDHNADDLTPEQLARFHQIYAQSCSRLGRLLRDREAMGGFDEGMNRIINRTLDELGEEWGVDL
jgi:hypothetical protein